LGTEWTRWTEWTAEGEENAGSGGRGEQRIEDEDEHDYEYDRRLFDILFEMADLGFDDLGIFGSAYLEQQLVYAHGRRHAAGPLE
jgi:hypothetical protein